MLYKVSLWCYNFLNNKNIFNRGIRNGIEKVNYYAKLSKKRKLTEEEIKDREIYRRMYLDKFKAQVKAHLDNIEIVDEKDFKN